MTDKNVRPNNPTLEGQTLDQAELGDEYFKKQEVMPSFPKYSFSIKAAEEYRKNVRYGGVEKLEMEPKRNQLLNFPQQKVIFKSAFEFCKAYIPVTHVVEPVLQSSKLYTLTARNGTGKTALLISSALAVVTGRYDILRLTVEKGRVAYLAFENPDDFCARLNMAVSKFNINLSDYQDEFVILDSRAKPEDIVSEVRKLAENGPFALIIIDTLAAIYDGNDLNSSVEAGNFMRRLRPLTQISGSPAVVVASHPIKNAEKNNLNPSGSGAILNEVDGNLTLWRSGSAGHTIMLGHDKLRASPFDPIPFCFENTTDPRIFDKKGRMITIPVMVPMSDPDTSGRSEFEEQLDIKVLGLLFEQPGISASNIGLNISRSTTSTNNRLHKLIELGFVQLIDRKWALTKRGLQHLGATDGSNFNQQKPPTAV